MSIDPWSGQREQPKEVTRDDLIEQAALALAGRTSGYTWTDRLLRESMIQLACEVLDSAYPQFESAAELDALPMGAVIIGPGGIAWQRVVTPGNNLVRNPHECWAQQAWTGSRTRVSSAQMVANGETYVLVHRVAS